MLQVTQDMKQALIDTQRQLAECISEYGYINTCDRYKYQILVTRAQSYRDSISWLESNITEVNA